MKPVHMIAAPLILLNEAIGAAPGEASARLAESPLSTTNLTETALGLLAVLAIMLLLAWLVKRYVQVPGMGRGQVQVLGGASLGAREKAVLLSVSGQRLLVGVAPGQVRTLLVLDDVDPATPDFERQFREVTGQQVEAGAEP